MSRVELVYTKGTKLYPPQAQLQVVDNVIKFEGKVLHRYKGCTGKVSWVRREWGVVAPMLWYLRWQNYDKFIYFRKIFKADSLRGKKRVALLPEEVEDLKREIFDLLRPDTQRKFISMGRIHH